MLLVADKMGEGYPRRLIRSEWRTTSSDKGTARTELQFLFL
jgi:hypothetical protein